MSKSRKKKKQKRPAMPQTIYVGMDDLQLQAYMKMEDLMAESMERVAEDGSGDGFTNIGVYELVSTGRVEAQFVKDKKK